MRRYAIVFLIVFSLALVLSSCMNSNLHPGTKNDTTSLHYLFKSGSVNILSAFTKLWTTPTGNWVVSSPALSPDQSTIYVGSVDHYLYAFNAQKGTTKWKVLLAGPVISSPSISINGNVYVVASTLSSISYSATGTGYLYKISPAGNKTILYTFTDIVGTSPLLDPNTGNIYIGCLDGKLYSISNSGHLNWAFQSNEKIGSSPVLSNDGNTIYFGSANGNFYAVNASSGNEEWSYHSGAAILSSPALDSNGNVYFGSTDDYVYALNSSGHLIWKYNTGSRIGSSPSISNGTLYIGNENGYLYAIDISNANVNWKYKTGGYILSSPAVDADGVVYVGSADGNLYAISCSSGSLLWKYNTGDVVGTSPVIGFGSQGGVIYFGSNSDSVYALATGNPVGLGPGPWPMFRRDVVHSAVGSVNGFKLLGDFDGTGKLDFNDLMDMAFAWGAKAGQSNYKIKYDIGPAATTQGYGYYDTAYPDGIINFSDLMVFALNWGKQAVNPPDSTVGLSAINSLPSITQESSGECITVKVDLENIMGYDLILQENGAKFIDRSGFNSAITLAREGKDLFQIMIAGQGKPVSGRLVLRFKKGALPSTIDIIKEELR